MAPTRISVLTLLLIPPTVLGCGGNNAGNSARDAAATADARSPADGALTPDAVALDAMPDAFVCPSHTACDTVAFPTENSVSIAKTIGLFCDGEAVVNGVSANGDVSARAIHAGQVGTAVPATYPVLEGDKMLILSTGTALDVLDPNSSGNTTLAGNDPGLLLPAPLTTTKVSDTQTCADDPSLVGKGDCSNTLSSVLAGTSGAFDYSEVRISMVVPQDVDTLELSYAYLSWEYPDFYGWAFNDAFVVWLESSSWTGNIAYDGAGKPMTIENSFFTYKDAPNSIDCPVSCTAPQLAGTGLEGHGGTPWLTTRVGVTPGETIVLVFAIFDVDDQIVDSAALIDDVHFSCAGAGAPTTVVR